MTDAPKREHPRTMGWVGTAALAMGGSNQMLFVVGALLAGQSYDPNAGLVGTILGALGIHGESSTIPGQGTAAIPLLAVGLLLSWMAVFGWTELILMFPNRVGGIAATCGEAFRPYAPVLGCLTGVCYWWGWVPTCGVTALLSASAIGSWFFHFSDATAVWAVPLIASLLVCFFAAVNLCGVKWIMRLTIPIAFISATLAFLSAVLPIYAGLVDWHQACSFHLDTPYPGVFGQITSAMAGLYLVGFAAPAFEAAACHVGETINPEKNVPRAMFAAAIMATLYFLVLPVIWLGTIGSAAMAGDLSASLGPTFAPLFGGAAKAAATGFMMFNMFHGTIAPLTGVCRTMSQLSDDGLMPEIFGLRMKSTDAPYVAILVTAGLAIVFLLIGDPIWLIAAANLTYLIGIAMPSIAVWLLRRDQPGLHRPYRAPRGTIELGVVAALVWGISTVLGFEQFGLPTVIFGLILAYSGAALYAWRKWADHRKTGQKNVAWSLHLKLTGAMLLVLILDGAGYLLAVQSIPQQGTAQTSALQDIFVAVALLTITVGLVLPGMIAHSAVELADAAERLAKGTLADFSRAMAALAQGDLKRAHANADIAPVVVYTRDEIGRMAENFNIMQQEVANAAIGLDGAREGLRRARLELQQANTRLETTNAQLELRVAKHIAEVETAHKSLVDAAWQAGMAEVAIGVLHNVGNVLNSVNTSASIVDRKVRGLQVRALQDVGEMLSRQDNVAQFIATDPRGRQIPVYLTALAEHLNTEHAEILEEITSLKENLAHIKQVVNSQQSLAKTASIIETVDATQLMEDAIRISFGSVDPVEARIQRDYRVHQLLSLDKHRVLLVLVNLISNAKHAIQQSPGPEPRLKVQVTLESEEGDASPWLQIKIIDNGMGISKENLSRLFTHGFTTRKQGHGFGLHSSATAARDVGGSLTATSDGPGLGATFTLSLPVSYPNGPEVQGTNP